MPLLYKIACSVVKGCCATVAMVRCAMMMPMSIHHITSQLSGACRPGCTNRSWTSHDCGTGAISTVAPCHCNAVASVAAGRLLHCWTLHPSGETAKHCTVTGLQTLNAPGAPSHAHTCHMIRCAGNLYLLKAEHAHCLQAQLQPVCRYLAEPSLHCNNAIMCACQ